MLNSYFVGYVTAGGSNPGASLPPTIQVRLDGNPTEIARGNTASVTWTSVNAPSNSAVRLQLHRTSNGSLVGEGGIVNDLPVSGVYTWQIPLVSNNSYCAAGTGILCPNYINDNTAYRVRAFLYEPRGACWGTSCYGGALASSRAIANTESFNILPYGTVLASVFSATPDNGVIPLAVIFSVQANQGGACVSGNYSLDFGDGSARQDISTGTACGAHAFAVSHTYISVGTWTAKFYNLPSSSVASSTIPLKAQTITTR